MSLSVMSAAVIATNDDIICTAGGPDKETGKWVGWITHGPEKYCRPIINTEPIFNTKREAVKAMEAIRKGCIDHFKSNRKPK